MQGRRRDDLPLPSVVVPLACRQASGERRTPGASPCLMPPNDRAVSLAPSSPRWATLDPRIPQSSPASTGSQRSSARARSAPSTRAFPCSTTRPLPSSSSRATAIRPSCGTSTRRTSNSPVSVRAAVCRLARTFLTRTRQPACLRCTTMASVRGPATRARRRCRLASRGRLECARHGLARRIDRRPV
jgi:hypothetical protein